MDFKAQLDTMRRELEQAIQEREEALLLAEKAAKERNIAEKAFVQAVVYLAQILDATG